MDAARIGSSLPPLPDDDAAQNAIIYAETKDLPLAAVKRAAADSWSAVGTALELISEEELARPHPRHPEAQVWEAVPGMGGHIGAHLMSWFMDHGDVARAESAAKWGYELECELTPEGAKRADAEYNLACFYARAGRVDDALPLLRASLAVNSELARWAHQDHDLDGIRDDPRVRELLGG